MQCLMSLYQTLQGNKRKAKSPARHREAHRSRLVRLGCEVMEDRVLMSAGLPDYHFTAPALVAGTTQHDAPSSIGAFTNTPGGTTQRIVSNGSIQAVAPAAPSFTAKAVSGSLLSNALGAQTKAVQASANGAQAKAVHASAEVGSAYALDAYYYALYAYDTTDAGSAAHTYAYDSAYYSYLGYQDGNATDDYYGSYYAMLTYETTAAGSAANTYAYDAYVDAYDAYLGY